MKFEDSGLPPLQLVQDAFEYSRKAVRVDYDAMLKDFQRQMAQAHRENVAMFEQLRKQGKMSEQEYTSNMEQLKAMIEHQLKAGPTLINRELDNSFAKGHVKPARELFTMAESSPPESLAAIMLLECVRSPKDFRAVEKEFGPVVADLLAELLHIEAYEESRKKHLDAAPVEAKRAYYALLISSLDVLGEKAEKLAKSGQPRRIVFPDGQENILFENTKALWGVDKQLDARILEVFNKTAGLLMSKLRLQKDQDGDLSLVAHVPPKPPANGNDGGKKLPVVRKPPGNGSIGGDVF